MLNDKASLEKLKQLCLEHWQKEAKRLGYVRVDAVYRRGSSGIDVTAGTIDFDFERYHDDSGEYEGDWEGHSFAAVSAALSEAGYVVLPKELFEDE